MQDMIQKPEELKEYFYSYYNATKKNKSRRDKKIAGGVYVTTKIRREVLADIDQGTIILAGRVERIEFESMQGGLWRAYIDLGRAIN